MPKSRGGRGRPPNFVEWVQGSPLGIMRQACVRSRKVVTCDHPKLRRIWRIRDAWLEKGKECGGNIPPGAFCRQKSGKPIPERRVEGNKTKSRPLPKENVCYINAIVHVQNGKTYVGRTIQNPYVRFQQHLRTDDPLGKAMLSHDSKINSGSTSKIVPLPSGSCEKFMALEKKENAWIHKLNSCRNGYNTRREIVKPHPPEIPSHGFDIRPIKRSRHEERISKVNGGFQGRECSCLGTGNVRFFIWLN